MMKRPHDAALGQGKTTPVPLFLQLKQDSSISTDTMSLVSPLVRSANP